MKYTPRTKPFRHQARATLKALKGTASPDKGMAFFMDPGTGKTKAVEDTVGMLAQAGRANRILVVCPIAAFAVWEDQILEHYPWRSVVRTRLEKPSLLEQDQALAKNTVWWLINYDLYRQRYNANKGKKRRDGKPRKAKWVYPYVKQIEKWAPDIVVLDESHRAGRAGGVTATALWRNVERMRQHKMVRVYLMTGTPKDYLAVFAQFRIMDPEIFGTAKADFEEIFCQYGQLPHNKYRVVRYHHKDVLLKKIKANAFVISKDKALDLPKQMWQNVPVSLPQKAREVYNAMAEDLLAEVEGQTIEAANAGVRRVRLQQITGGFTTEGVEIHRAKLVAASDLMFDLYEQDENLVVYATYLPEVHALGASAKKLGYRTHVVFGGTKHADRALAVREFQNRRAKRAGAVDPVDSTPVCLVFQVATGSLAITLTAGREALFYSLPDSWVHYWQALSRLHRQGQTRSVRYRHLIARGTLDSRQLQTLKEKSSMHAELMGNPRGFLFGE